MQYHFNRASSPDRAPIENRWQTPKQYMGKYPRWDDASTKALIQEKVSQASINERVRSLSNRLEAVLAAEGKTTGL